MVVVVVTRSPFGVTLWLVVLARRVWSGRSARSKNRNWGRGNISKRQHPPVQSPHIDLVLPSSDCTLMASSSLYTHVCSWKLTVKQINRMDEYWREVERALTGVGLNVPRESARTEEAWATSTMGLREIQILPLGGAPTLKPRPMTPNTQDTGDREEENRRPTPGYKG